MDKFEAYFQATSKSFAGQTNNLVILRSHPGQVHRQPLGFQPFGIASKPLRGGKDLVALAHYGGPAVALIMIERTAEGLVCQFNWIRGVLYQGQSVRLFPNVSEPSGANRLYTVNFGPDDTLWISRGDREFFILEPPQVVGEKWHLADRTVVLPVVGEDRGFYSMEAALRLADGRLFTIEASLSLEDWLLTVYQELPDGSFELKSESRVDPYTFGIGMDSRGSLWTTTDYRFTEGSLGLRKNQLFVSGPMGAGNGICCLSDGSALATVYGAEYPHIPGGVPGELVHIPTELF